MISVVQTHLPVIVLYLYPRPYQSVFRAAVRVYVKVIVHVSCHDGYLLFFVKNLLGDYLLGY